MESNDKKLCDGCKAKDTMGCDINPIFHGKICPCTECVVKPICECEAHQCTVHSEFLRFRINYKERENSV